MLEQSILRDFGNIRQASHASAVRELRLLCERDAPSTTPLLLIDSTCLHADAFIDPGERCLSLYQNALQSSSAHLFLVPPAPPSGEQSFLTAAQLLQAPSFFHSFLIAALHASAQGRITVLLPSVQSSSEIRAARHMLQNAMSELYAKGEDFDELLTLGICLGTPNALATSEELLEEADLLTVDTDLLSHTVTELTTALRLARIAIKNAHVLNRFSIVSGALTADHRALPQIFAMGPDAIQRPFSSFVEISDKFHTKSSCK